MCPECSAGSGVPSVDLQDEPVWTRTLYETEPWNETPVVCRIPFAASKAASMLHKDAFHTLKYGFLQDLSAGVIMFLCQLQFFDTADDESRSMDARLERACQTFRLWCLAERKTSSLRKFSITNNHIYKASSFPFLPGTGADAVLVCMFLEFYVKPQMGGLLEDSHWELFSAMLQTLQGALAFMGIYHSHGLFLPRTCARFMLKCGYRLLKGYCFLAQTCIVERRRFFCFAPKGALLSPPALGHRDLTSEATPRNPELPCAL